MHSPNRSLPAAFLLTFLLVGCDRSPAPPPALPGAPAGEASEPPPSADPPSEPTAEAPTGAPRIAFDRAEHDFGKILDVHVQETTFTFTNTGDGPLVISRVESSPGVIVGELEKMTYAPGETGEVRIRFEPIAYGPHRKFAQLRHNVEPLRYSRMALAADVEGLIALTPRYLNLGPIEMGQPSRHSVELRSNHAQFEITSIDAPHPNVHAEVVDGAGPEDPKRLEVTIDEQAPWGPMGLFINLQAKVTMDGQTEARDYQTRLPLQATVLGAIHPAPVRITIESTVGEALDGRVLLQHRDGEPFEVLATEIQVQGLPDMVVGQEQVESGWFVIASGPAPTAPGTHVGRVIVHTDVVGEEELAVPVYVQVGGAGPR